MEKMLCVYSDFQLEKVLKEMYAGQGKDYFACMVYLIFVTDGDCDETV